MEILPFAPYTPGKVAENTAVLGLEMTVESVSKSNGWFGYVCRLLFPYGPFFGNSVKYQLFAWVEWPHWICTKLLCVMAREWLLSGFGS